MGVCSPRYPGGSDGLVHARFEAPRAIVLAVAMVCIVGVILTVVVFPAAQSPAELVSTLIWYPLALGQTVFILGPVTSMSGIRNTHLLKILTIASSAALLLVPLALPIHGRGMGKISGAAQAGASFMVCRRSWQLVRAIETARASSNDLGWGFGRRLYMVCAWSWHDLEHTKPIPAGSKLQHLRQLVHSMGSWGSLGVAVAACKFAHTTWITPIGFSSIDFVIGTSASATGVAVGFNLFDLTVRSLHAGVNGLDVPSIFALGLFMHADTLEDFWRGWNIPVQRIIANGVYKPLVRARCPAAAAKAVCFIVSGLAHTWPLAAAGAPLWALGRMCSFFALQPLLIAVEKLLRLRGRLYLFSVIICTSALFVEPLSALDL